MRQEAVAAEFGTSQGPVREAFRMLAGEGLLVHRANHGYRVIDIDAVDVDEVRIVRGLLEDEAYRLVVRALADDDMPELTTSVGAVEAALALPGEVPADAAAHEMVSAHRALHDRLLDRYATPRLRALTGMFQRHALRMRRATLGADVDGWRATLDADLRLVAACRAGDVEAALAVLAAERSRAAVAVANAIDGRSRLRPSALAGAGAATNGIGVSTEQMGDRHG